MTRSSDFQDPELVRKEIAGVNWYHQIDLGDGIVTPGVDDTANRMAPLELPADLAARACSTSARGTGSSPSRPSDGERAGCSRPSYCWNGEGWGTKEGFDTARRILGSRVEDFEIDVMDLSPERVGTFDVVLFVACSTTCDTPCSRWSGSRA